MKIICRMHITHGCFPKQVDVMRSTLKNRQDWLGGRLNLQNSTVSTNCSGTISNVNYAIKIN